MSNSRFHKKLFGNIKMKALYNRLRCDENVLAERLNVMNKSKGEMYVRSIKRRIDISYTAVVLFTLIALIISIIISATGSDEISTLKRSSKYGEDINIPLEVEAVYKGEKIKGPVDIDISSKKLTEIEQKEVIEAFADSLNDLFVTDENGIIYADSDITLPVKDEIYGIDIEWDSSDSMLITDDGKINVLFLATEEETVTLSAELSLGDFSLVKTFDVVLRDNPEMYKDSMREAVNRVVSDIEENETDDVLKLPDSTEEGVTLIWKTRKESYLGVIIIAGLVGVMVIYSRRYKSAEKMAEKYRLSVCNEFLAVPERFLLLVDSGMTAYNALMRICENQGNGAGGERKYIDEELAEIKSRVMNYNCSLITEWKHFATRMQSGDMLRFCSIVEDNMTKGSELSEKMVLECKNMRESRRKNIQEKIRIMDSKMMMPMMLMVFSLILVAVAPAMMEF